MVEVDSNKKNQFSIYENLFDTPVIDYDNFLLAPNDYIREGYFKLLNPASGQSVLEVGIGISSFLFRAQKAYGLKVYGLDFISTSLSAQRANFGSHLHLAQGDGERLPFKDGTFDMVVAISVIEHFSNYKAAFKEISRILKEGGKCLIQVPCKDFKHSLFGRFRGYEELKNVQWFKAIENASGHDYSRIPDRHGWRFLIEGSGLQITLFKGSDILCDAFYMYYFFDFAKRLYKLIKKFKTRQSPKNGPGTQSEEASTPGVFELRKYSFKRRLMGALWYYGVLKVLRILLIPERLLGKWPLGAALYITDQKPKI